MVPKLGLGHLGVMEDHSIDEAHDVERRSVDRLVVTKSESFGYRHSSGAEGGDDAVLATHVMSGGQHHAPRRSSQHDWRAVGRYHLVREVGMASLDKGVGVGAARPGDVLIEPG